MNKRTWKLLTGKVDTYDDTGFPDMFGQYDADGWPVVLIYCGIKKGDKKDE